MFPIGTNDLLPLGTLGDQEGALVYMWAREGLMCGYNMIHQLTSASLVKENPQAHLVGVALSPW